MKIINTGNNSMISEDCKVADTFLSRFRGLMGKHELLPGSGLLIIPCKSIHMLFMKFPLDIIFINRDNVVVYIVEGIKPWRVSKIIKNAHSVLELPVGSIKILNTKLGDRIELV